MSEIPHYIQIAKSDFELFYSNPEKYKDKVVNLSNMLGLTAENKLQEDFLPGYLAGNYQKGAKYVFIGINPGFDKNQNIIEEKLKDQTWDKYHNFILNFFDIFSNAGFKSPYFTRLYNLIAGLEKEEAVLTDRSDKIRYMQGKVMTMELIPYHSSRFSSDLDDPLVKEYLKERLNLCYNFIKGLDIPPKLVVFNGGPFKKLLIDNNLWDAISWNKEILEWTTTSERKRSLDIYYCKNEALSCVLFSTFLMSARGLTNNHLINDIPSLLREQLEF